MPTSPRKHISSPVRRKRPGLIVRLLANTPGWALWVGSAVIILGYVWAFYYFFVGPFGFRWRALYGDASYPQGYEIRGIDISHYQGDIDWGALRNDATIERCPIRFVVVKATEGASKEDSKFKDNFTKAREFGFIRGAYHFWSTRSSGADQARHFISRVKLEEGDLPPVLDVEHKGKGQTDEELRREVRDWLDIVEKHYKAKPIIYTFYKFKTKYLDGEEFDQYPYWIAHYYVDKVEYTGKWKFWQHTDCGRLPGIKGYVDFDIYNGSFYDLQQLTIR